MSDNNDNLDGLLEATFLTTLLPVLVQLEAAVPVLLSRLKLAHGSITVTGTPRRLAIIVEELALRQEDSREELRGPPAGKAYDVEGKPTKVMVKNIAPTLDFKAAISKP